MISAHHLTIKDFAGNTSTLEICVGDILSFKLDEYIDLLCFSAFSNDYYPMPGTIVWGLSNHGVDVSQVASDKHRDWRQNWQSWISKPLNKKDLPINRILCFEHGGREEPSNVVGNIFRSVSELLLETPNQSMQLIRLPLLSTGNQGFNKSLMLEALIRQAYIHLRAGMQVDKIQLVLWSGDPEIHKLLIEIGILFEKIQSEWALMKISDSPKYDYFVSYRREDSNFVNEVIDQIRIKEPSSSFFVDGDALKDGVFWKPQLITGLYESQKALCFISESYASSVECMDEFHAALCCSQYRSNFIKPLLCQTPKNLIKLPKSIQRVQLINALCPPQSINNLVDIISS